MNNRQLATCVVVAFVVGSGSVGLAIANSSELGPDSSVASDPSDLPPETQEALAAGEGGFAPTELLPAFPDSGPPSDVALVRAAVVRAMAAADGAARVTPADMKLGKKEKMARYLAPDAKKERRKQLEESLTARKVEDVLPRVESGLELNLTDPRYADSAYTDNQFVVTEHEGVAVDGGASTVLLRGYHRYLGLDRQWWSTPVAQYQVSMVRDDAARGASRWRLHEWTAVLVGEASEPGAVEEDS